MRARVYESIGEVELQARPKPGIVATSDIIVKVSKTTICGSDLHIRKGTVTTCEPGLILGHEGVGVIEEVGTSVTKFKNGDHVVISGIISCSACEYCRKSMYSHCKTGGWQLGNTIDGTQAEYIRAPHADTSLHPVPIGVDEEKPVMLSDIFPTGVECGVLNGKVQPGSTVPIVRASPIGLAALITAQMYSPSMIVVIDMYRNRLDAATKFGAHHTVDPEGQSPVDIVKGLTDGKGCDTVIEAVGVPQSFELCQRLLAPGGTLANIGIHGTKATWFLEDLWGHNISKLFFAQLKTIFINIDYSYHLKARGHFFQLHCC
jgi:alcohol dehydrogenase